MFGTLAEAIDEIQKPNVKVTRPYKTYDGPLTLGDPKTFDGALSVNIERYFLTKVAHPPSATTVVVRNESAEGATQSTHTLDEMEGVEMSNVDFAAVKSERVYTVDDPARLGGKREVDFADLEKGYEYGRTAVHISEDDHNITQLPTEKDFSIVGFIPRVNVSTNTPICARMVAEAKIESEDTNKIGRAVFEYGRELHHHAAPIQRG